MKQLNFDQEYAYPDDEEGISIAVKLAYAGRRFEVLAKVDPGAAVCLFSREVGLKLGIPIEQGELIRLGTLGGSLEAFGHEVTLQTGDIAFQSFVYFAKYSGLQRNLLGRRGWLRNLRLGLIDYDNLLYLSAYDSN
ncbi:MAG TPA: retropepsin-like aspartic protease [Blastocatellia bacterium]|nr:retropepsin-like aspartic protease [Blastocatellia bacterium]HMV82582.1 retropepsin-like aspartic protease [Blastocatellia bacterium]HMX26187.1 retropepsin-like aspartic protease [Blastocatellia bacterium]HMY76906.1 retropepsin-like aspartic protease [Blastocatellia bacterium]HMZ18040.1 retropepsin-like aspartic protease [Blastocatellia bacterium]